MEFESLIFDIDGTLWDSRALVAEGYNAQLEKEGLRHLFVNPEILATVFGKTMTEIADILFDELPLTERYDLMERCMNRENGHILQSDTIKGYDGVKETLESLAEEYGLYIVSNSQQGYPEVCMEKIGLTHLIRGHLCFGDTGTEKGQTILELMRRHEITDAVYVGDTQGDYEATLVAGIPFVWAAYGFGNPAGFDARIDNMRQLPQVLEGL